ncbi:MAG TPA: PIN domain-containing protein [Candidatus Baltobacteraceae bacterium]|nr:PIN domain-containing protein [Candidatus Baltobacteraceae bacterium]
MAVIIDTYAWMEYFRGSEAGRRVRGRIEEGRNITPTIVLAEISKRFTDLDRGDLKEKLAFIHSKSNILPLDQSTAIMAGQIRSTIGIKDMGLVDCILLAAARTHGIKVLTGDRHFRSLKEAEYFGTK